MKTKVKLSVIVPIYNSSEFLGDCLESLIAQEFESGEYEIVCVDDGSTDNSLQIIKDYANKYSFITVYQKENGGVASTRNYGIKKARGEYLAFVDSDDFICANTLKSLVNILDDKNADFMQFSYTCIDEQTRFKEEKIEKLTFLENKVHAEKAPFQMWALLMKRDRIVESNLTFRDVFRTREDYIFNFLLFALNENNLLIQTDAPIYRYRVRKGSLTHIMDYRSEAFQVERMNDMVEYVKECYQFILERLNISEETRNIVKLKMEYFIATALLCSLRCRNVNAKDVQKMFNEMGVYPYKDMFKKNDLKKHIKLAITSFPIFNIINFCGLLRWRTK